MVASSYDHLVVKSFSTRTMNMEKYFHAWMRGRFFFCCGDHCVLASAVGGGAISACIGASVCVEVERAYVVSLGLTMTVGLAWFARRITFHGFPGVVVTLCVVAGVPFGFPSLP